MDNPAAVAADTREPGRLDELAAEILGLLRLETAGVDSFRDRGVPGASGRLYGGQVAAQALAAAGHTVTGARPHSLHAYFLRPGDAGQRVVFQVDRLHDGRTFCRRRVTAMQQGQPILCLECSFTSDPSDASDYHPAPPVPGPEECGEYDGEANSRLPARLAPWHLLEARPVPGAGMLLPRLTSGDLWFRFRTSAAADGIPPEVIVTYLSDLTIAAAALRPTRAHPSGRQDVIGLTSLDHSVWFHNPVDLSDWLLYTKTAPATGELRGLATGQIFNRDGTLVASVTQECLMHTRR